MTCKYPYPGNPIEMFKGIVPLDWGGQQTNSLDTLEILIIPHEVFFTKLSLLILGCIAFLLQRKIGFFRDLVSVILTIFNYSYKYFLLHAMTCKYPYLGNPISV